MKSIIVKRDKLTVDSSNNTEDFNKYINESKNENLLLRYQYLTGFIDNTKTDKLKYLSDIIGFSEVTKTKDVLGKSYRAITREIKSQNFEGQINTQKKTLLENLEATISQENQLFDKINEKTKPCR
ncbi:MAG: hypothetical protein GX879_07855 [Bacteroidales bacterium]|nr:hypothetical protein [Bacteroidales bacterium]